MSSTNRSGKTAAERDAISDYYFTPEWAIDEFLAAFEKLEPTVLNSEFILDPCAGGDEKSEAQYPIVLKRRGYRNIHSMDIRPNSRAEFIGNYITTDIGVRPCFIVTNPPFAHAQAIIEKAITDVRDGGFVAMLARLNFFGTLDRIPFWRTYPAKYAFVHAKRIKFNGAANTDSIEYMHCVWQRGHKPEHTQLHIIRGT